ncbi:MAG: hypothetical protein HW387_420 [Parachlamydiales bacterium]|nr:hypothetical protein [Parachlamydiales bacterium]
MPRAHAIESTSYRRIETIPFYSPITVPAAPAIDSRSTIAPASRAENISPSIFRPQLVKPDQHFMLPILDLFTEEEKLIKSESTFGDRDTNNALERLMAIDKKKIEKLAAMHKELDSKKTWSAFETVAQYIASASSIVMGVAVFVECPVAGGFLIAGGGLGLVNRAVSDSGGWEWMAARFTASTELQRRYAERADMCLVFISTALTMAGAIRAYHVGALNAVSANRPEAIMNKALQILTIGGGAIRCATRIGMTRLDQKIFQIKADIKKLDTDKFCTRQEIQTTTENVIRILELSDKLNDSIKQSINASAT